MRTYIHILSFIYIDSDNFAQKSMPPALSLYPICTVTVQYNSALSVTYYTYVDHTELFQILPIYTMPLEDMGNDLHSDHP